MEAAHIPWRPLGQILVDKGLLTADELDESLAEQVATGRRLGEILISRGLLSGPMLTVALAEQLGAEVTTETGFGTGLWAAIRRGHRTARAFDGLDEAPPVPEPTSGAESLHSLRLVPPFDPGDPSADTAAAELESLHAKIASLEAKVESLAATLEELTGPPSGAHGTHDLVTARQVAAMLGLKPTRAGRLLREPGFPPAALLVAGKRLWLRSDVRAYADGRPFPVRWENQLRTEYIDAGELAAAVGVGRRTLSGAGSRNIPPPSLRVAGVRLWRTREVEAWLRERSKAP